MRERSRPSPVAGAQGWFRRDVQGKLQDTVGGAARLRVIVLLACVLALDSADKATIGAPATQLEAALHIGNTDIGLLAAVSTAVGAVATLPLGALTDRVNRTRLLTAAITVAAVAALGQFSSRCSYAADYPRCQAYPQGTRCASAGAVSAATTPPPAGTGSPPRTATPGRSPSPDTGVDVALPRGQGYGNVVACHVGLIGPPLRSGGTGQVLVLAENIAMADADALMAQPPRPRTLAQIYHPLSALS